MPSIPSNPTRPWVSVFSSNISQFAYDDGRRELYVEFNTGARYIYYDVPLDVYTRLMAAQSTGSFFAAEVKGSYRYVKADR